MENRAVRGRRRSLPVVHAVALLFGGAVGTAEHVALAGSRRTAGGYLVLVAGSVPALWLPLMWVAAEKELGEPFGSWSDVIDAGFFWTLFVLAAGVVASRPSWRRRHAAGSDER